MDDGFSFDVGVETTTLRTEMLFQSGWHLWFAIRPPTTIFTCTVIDPISHQFAVYQVVKGGATIRTEIGVERLFVRFEHGLFAEDTVRGHR